MNNNQHVLIFLLLVLFSIFIGVTRLHTYYEPLERDLALYAVIGHEINQGRKLYADLWDHKPPAIYATFALGERVFGYGHRQLYFMNWGTAVLTMMGLFLLVNSMTGNRAISLWAAVFWVVICGDLTLEANQPNSEVFINACMVWGLALFLGSRKPSVWIISGLMFAIASLFKQIIVAPIVTVLGAALVLRFEDRKTTVKKILFIGVTGLAVWGSVMLYFSVTGRWNAFYEAVFEYNLVRYGSLFDNLVVGLQPGRLMPGYLALPMGLLFMVGLGLSLYNKNSGKHLLFCVAWAAGTWVAVSMTGSFFRHYYQLWLPVVVVGCSLGQWCIVQTDHHWLVHGAGVLVLLLLLFHELPFYQIPAEDWSKKKYGDLFITCERLGKELNQLLKPEETFYQFGNESSLYFYSQRSPLTGIVWADSLLQKPFAAKYSKRVIAELEKAPPDLFISDQSIAMLAGSCHPVIQWFSTCYLPLPKNPVRGPFKLFVRRGSKLEKRLNQQSTYFFYIRDL
jgi:hypothetical protein